LPYLQTNRVQIHPLHPPFLHFYTALSHEAVARSTHNLSATKPRTLQLARESYEAAAASLPRPATLAVTAKDDENDDYEEEEDANSSTRSFSDTASSYSVTSSHTPNDDDDDDNERPTSPHPTTQPPPPRRPASPAPSPPSTTSTAALRPSPLRIRKKAVHFPPTPPRSHPSPPPSFPHRPNPSTASYNTHLISFATTLQTRIHAVDALLHRTDVAQQHGRRGAGGDGEAEGREARIERLRAGGWRRERFVAGRCEEVCARALAEL